MGAFRKAPTSSSRRGRGLDDPEDAIVYFQKHLSLVWEWPPQKRSAFLYFFGNKVEQLDGTDIARPLFAASLAVDASPDVAAWLPFPNIERT